MTQKERVLEILLRDGQVDNFYCLNNKISIRLGAIINVLRKQGYNFRGEYLEGTKNYCYYLINEETNCKATQKETMATVPRDNIQETRQKMLYLRQNGVRGNELSMRTLHNQVDLFGRSGL